jgi:toxin-antitoxin system PIN domain toxin
MLIPDLNLLIYATNTDSPLHAQALAWWQTVLGGSEPIGIAPVVAFGFIRLTTHPRVCPRPLTPAQAIETLHAWLALPGVVSLTSDPRHLEITLGLLQATGAAGNLTTDAQIAAHGIQQNGTVFTTDTDFARFPGLRVRNPLLPSAP